MIKNNNIKKEIKESMLNSNLDLSKEFGSLKNILKKPTKDIMKIIDEGWD